MCVCAPGCGLGGRGAHLIFRWPSHSMYYRGLNNYLYYFGGSLL